MKRAFFTVSLFVIAAQVYAGFEPVYAQNGMVVSTERHATQAGVEILKQGGNAFDAAVAVGFALAVTYPAAGNIGGGGFLVGLTAEGERIALDFREKAPLKATRNMYLDENGEFVSDLSTNTLLAVGVPGTVHGLLSVLEDYGNTDRGRVLAPAIRLAEDGFPVNYSLARSLKNKDTRKRLTRFPSTAAVLYPNGEPLRLGETWKQPELAQTLRMIRDKGKAGFYEGQTADLLVDFMHRHGGIITHEDLHNYSSKYREPFCFTYKQYELITHPVPSSGGVTLAQILKLIEPMHLQKMGYGSAKYVHALVEAERLAFADRNYYLGDPDFVDVPDDTLISDEYIRERRKQIPPNKAGKSARVSEGALEHLETTHYCVVDKHGNVVAVTYTLNGSYGMGAVVEEAGFLLNNEMDDFSAKPGEPNMYGLVGAEANAIEPGKRMLSSMTPTIVTRDGRFDFTIGTPGGPTIITTNLQVFLNISEFGMNIREAIDQRRFHHQWLPDVIRHEPFAFSPDTERKLRIMGYELDESEGTMGHAAGIQLLQNGVLAGYDDGRGSGLAAGY